mmetsp:Transcript_26418/g.53556  ORF Transcript_26418/g.53556 Transcript_26418/m.53556 type:complete len:245 (-) Transcript_26418:85-819(-)
MHNDKNHFCTCCVLNTAQRNFKRASASLPLRRLYGFVTTAQELAMYLLGLELSWESAFAQGGGLRFASSAVPASSLAACAFAADFFFFLLGPASGNPQSFIFQPSSMGMEAMSARSRARRSSFRRSFSVMGFLFSLRGTSACGAGSFSYCKMRERSLGSRMLFFFSISESACSSFSSNAFTGAARRPATRPAMAARLKVDVQLTCQPAGNLGPDSAGLLWRTQGPASSCTRPERLGGLSGLLGL